MLKEGHPHSKPTFVLVRGELSWMRKDFGEGAVPSLRRRSNCTTQYDRFIAAENEENYDPS